MKNKVFPLTLCEAGDEAAENPGCKVHLGMPEHVDWFNAICSDDAEKIKDILNNR